MTDEVDLQAQIKSAVEDATLALVGKNRELLSELKDARKGRTIDPAELDKMQARIDELEDGATASAKQAKEQKALLEKAHADLQSESGFTSKLLLDNGLTDALVKAGVSAPYLPAVKAMLSSQAKITVEGDIRKAVIGDKDLGAYITDWATSDDGKHYVQAPANSGGGANGGANGGSVKTVARSGFDTMSQSERSSFIKQGGKVTE
jgi:hypothetical protein|tara:strand:- start:3892 stop:4509 length:618 start_codon:yes stop_codon:yes gene_type:complete